MIIVVGFDPMVLWILLPVATFGSAYIAKVASFAAGQAAFTMLLLITFNLIAPTGWRVGLVRIEDVVVGCLACIVVSLLLWPRGARRRCPPRSQQAVRCAHAICWPPSSVSLAALRKGTTIASSC